MNREIPKAYSPSEIEEKWYKYWLDNRLFEAKPNKEKKPYTVVIPPPNITGILTMGHVLNNSIQDVFVRWRRMKGYEACWVPGTDHAGIATQNVVEKSLAKEGKDRHSLGREKFVELVWQWREQYGGTIIRQLKKLGVSCDWTRERFTMDEGLSHAVQEVFVRLYEKGLIYRGKYIVNWCPKDHTAISDDEVEYQEKNGKLYYLKYPLEDGSGHVVVATTRPETMLGDVAVAVNPADERYKHMVGKNLVLPLVGRKMKVIADDYVDKEFGTGAVKITPAHDPNDFRVAERHGLEKVIVLDISGKVNENAPEKYRGLDRFKARKQVIEDLQALGLVEKIDDYKLSIGECYRCHTVIEPYLSDQWFVRMKPLAEPALQAVRDGKIRFYPERWVKTYEHWMENIRDWCISRQLWWGHRIPVWYCETCGELTVSTTRPAKPCGKCGGTILQAGRRCTRHVVLVVALAVLRLRISERDRRLEIFLSDRHSRHRSGYNFLLGREDGHVGTGVHEGSSVQGRLFHKRDPRHAGEKDVEVAGQFSRPARRDRGIRSRCPSLHDPLHGSPRTGRAVRKL